MTYTKQQLRLGRTAIAAVLAFSSTPLVAQPASAPPVVTVPTPAPPLANQPAPAAPSNRVLSAPAMEPVTNEPPRAAEAREAPARRATTALAPARTRAAARAAAPAVAARPVAQAGPAIEAAPVAPIAAAPIVDPVVPMTAEPVGAPVESAASEGGTDVLPIAGGAAALLALAGGAYALSRRRRDEDVEPVEADHWERDHVAPAETPAVAAWEAPQPEYREPVAAPVPAMAAAAAVPAGMDLSRYGRHVQAAYAGPTPDNPSLSLKRRLKRAAFFDQRERMAIEAAATPAPVAAAARSEEAMPALKRPATVTSRRVGPQSSTQALFGGFRPAFQN